MLVNLIVGELTEADLLNPYLDKALANEVEMFMEMTKRDAIRLKKLDNNWNNNELILLDHLTQANKYGIIYK